MQPGDLSIILPEIILSRLCDAGPAGRRLWRQGQTGADVGLGDIGCVGGAGGLDRCARGGHAQMPLAACSSTTGLRVLPR